jgi:hypothetical protein
MDNEFKKLDFHNLKLFLEDYFFFFNLFYWNRGLEFCEFFARFLQNIPGDGGEISCCF